jgi:hypothetical protein
MNPFAAAGFACVAALALWKGTKERWVFALIGMFIIAITVKYTGKAYDADDSFSGWLIWMVGMGVFMAGAFGLKWYDKRIEQITKSNPSHILAKKLPDPKPEPEEPEFHLDVTTERASKESEGGEYWDVFPNQKRLILQLCSGGSLTREEIYEYAVRHTSVFVRLIEESKEISDEREYEVFGGSINTARLEEDYAKKSKKYENDVNKDLFLRDTPAIVSAELQKKIVWHEIYGAVRYFILDKDVPVVYEANFFREELKRFTDAFTSIEKKAEELGAVWSEWRYKAPEGATIEAKEEVEKQLSVFNFGFRNIAEFLQKDVILSILKNAVEHSGKSC